ncbi:MAG: hypothetical protein WCG87_05160, partial [Bacteroidota bacterium]
MHYLKQILFIDIETAPVVPEFNSLSEAMQVHWAKKAQYLKSSTDPDASPAMLFEEKAGIFSEFSKVVCISIGRLVEKDNGWKLGLKSFTEH